MLCALAFALALAAWFLLATEPGARWLFTRVGATMAGSLEVEALAGPIRGPLSLTGLVYESEGFEVRIERLRLDWRLAELLARRLDIVSIAADGVTVLLADRDERDEPQPLPDVHLPVNIIVRAARVRDIEVVRAGAEPLVLDALDLATTAIGDAVEVERLTLESPTISAVAAGRVEPRGDYPVDLRLEWSAMLPGQPRWAGAGTFAGTLEELRVEHDLDAPVAARIEATLGTPLRNLSFDARVAAPPFFLDALGGDLPADVTLGGRVRARGTVEALAATVDLTADTPQTGPARVQGSLVRDGERWHFDRLVLTSTSGPTRIEAEGELRLAEGEPPRFDLRAAWTDLAWPLTGEATVTAPKGRAEIAGDLSAYDLTTDLVLAEPLVSQGLPPAPLELNGRGGEDRLVLERATARLLEGTVSVTGEVAWSPRVDWDLEVEGRGLDPSVLWPDGAGRLAIAARTSGHLTDAGPVGRIAPLRLAGTLRGEPLEAAGAVRLDAEQVEVSGLDLDWGSIRLTADGRLTPSFDFGFALEAPNLGLALPGAAGALTAEGRISGPFETPRLVVTAAGEGLSHGEVSAGAVAVEADLDLAPGGALDLDVEAIRLALGERAFERVALTGAGTREDHRLTLDGEAEEAGLHLAAQGGVANGSAGGGTWRGTLRTLDLDVPAAGSWTLAGPAAVTASAETIEVDRLCEVSGPARICAAGIWRDERGWRAATELTAVPLALAASFLPPDLEISGAVEGGVEARAGADGAIAVVADLRPGPGELVYPLTDGGTETLLFGRGSLTASAGAGGLEASLELPLPELGSAAAALELPGYRLAGAPADDQRISGTLTANITDLGFLQAFSEQLDDTAGRLVAGRALLEDGRAAVPELGIRLTELRLLATGEESPGGEEPLGGGLGPLRIEGAVRSGEGTLTLNGVAPPIPGPEHPIRLEVAGRRFLAMNTPEIRMLADPDLEVTFDGARLAVTGEVAVPEAEVEIGRPPRAAAVPSADVVYVGEEPQDEAAGLPIAMRVRVVLGKDVEIDVMGLAAEPEGSLLLVEEPGRATRATGEIDLAGGTYRAYGQDLTIERGRLIFAGPVDNPRIDLRAYREARDGVVAGLEAAGTLERPEITLWSEPPMDQSNQLSYLLLGRPIGQAGSEDGDLLANAATSLGIKGGNLLAERLAARYGLEEARIETEGGVEEASLVLGKYLSPRLYVAYGVGLFEAANTLRIRYLLSSKWTLEATTGESNAADLLYTIERGHGASSRAPSDRDALEPREAPDAGGDR
jgi:translocation and assembly module TamB